MKFFIIHFEYKLCEIAYDLRNYQGSMPKFVVNIRLGDRMV